MMKEQKLSPAGAEIVGALTEFYETLGEGCDAVAKKFTVRTVELNLEPHTYDGKEVRRIRKMLRLSQPLFARFLGVSANAVRAWENGGKSPSGATCRLLDEMSLRPDYWKERLRELIVSRAEETSSDKCLSR